MRAACVAPCCGSNLEVRLVAVHDPGHRQLRHRLRLLHQLDVRTDDPEMIAQVNQRALDAVSRHTVENQARRVILAADSKRMHLNLRLCRREGSRYLQHVGGKLQLVSRCQIVGIILNEAGRSLSSLCHLHENGGEGTDLVVALRSEPDALRHQILCRKPRQLAEAVQILEVVGEGRHTICGDELLECDLITRLCADCLYVVGRHRVAALIVRHLRIDLVICHLSGQIRDLADSPVLNLPAVLDLAFEPVAVRDRDIAHVVAECRHACSVGEPDCLRDLCETADLLNDRLMLIEARHHFMANSELCQDEAVLAVTMCRLIQVHEVHVNGIVRQLLVGLRVKVQKRLLKQLKPLDPHFRRGKCMHPGDDADAVVVNHDLFHILDADLGRLNGRQKLDPDHVPQLLIQEIDHLLAVLPDGLKALSSIKILASRDKI